MTFFVFVSLSEALMLFWFSNLLISLVHFPFPFFFAFRPSNSLVSFWLHFACDCFLNCFSHYSSSSPPPQLFSFNCLSLWFFVFFLNLILSWLSPGVVLFHYVLLHFLVLLSRCWSCSSFGFSFSSLRCCPFSSLFSSTKYSRSSEGDETVPLTKIRRRVRSEKSTINYCLVFL